MPIKKTFQYQLIMSLALLLLSCAMLFNSCTKEPGYTIPSTKVTGIIQLSANNQVYSLASAPDAVNFSTTAVTASKPNFRQYLINGDSSNGTLSLSVSFHIDSIGSGIYKLNGSQLVIGSKHYISTASKSTDKIVVTKLDATNKIYKGSFSFYAFNLSVATDSVLVTGTYSIE